MKLIIPVMGLVCSISLSMIAKAGEDNRSFGFPPPSGEVVEIKGVRIYTIDTLIEEKHLHLPDEAVLVKDFPYGNIRTTGAIV